MAAKRLRSVSDAEAAASAAAAEAERKKTQSLADAIAGGDYLEILEAQQREIATDLPNEKGPAKAAMHRQLALLSKEIQQLRAARKQEAAEDGAGVPADEPFDASAV